MEEKKNWLFVALKMNWICVQLQLYVLKTRRLALDTSPQLMDPLVVRVAAGFSTVG